MNLPYNHPASQTLSAAISDATDTARRCALHYVCGVLDIARPGEIQPDRLRADIILQLLQKDEHPEFVKIVETPAATPDGLRYWHEDKRCPECLAVKLDVKFGSCWCGACGRRFAYSHVGQFNKAFEMGRQFEAR